MKNENHRLWILPILIFPLVLWSCYFVIDLYLQSRHPDSSTVGFVRLFIMFVSYGLLLFCAIPFNKKTDKNIAVKRVYYTLLLIPTFISYVVISGLGCKSTLCLLNPFNFLPALIVFWFLIKGIKHKKIYVLLFFALPIFIIANDKINEYKFVLHCKNNFPQDELNPIYLPKEYFSRGIFIKDQNARFFKKPLKLKSKSVFPNEADIYLRDDLRRDFVYKDTPCNFITSEMKASIIRNGYIVMCNSDYNKDENFGTDILFTYSENKIVGTDYYFKKYEYKKSRSKLVNNILQQAKSIECSTYPWDSLIKLKED